MRPVFLKPVSRNYYAKKAPHRISAFGGYDHRPVIQDGAWYDEQNLSSDQYPLLTVRRNRRQLGVSESRTPHRWDISDIGSDGFTLPWQAFGVLAFCANDSLTVLDTNGVIYAGDQQMLLLPENNMIEYWFYDGFHYTYNTNTVMDWIQGPLGGWYGYVMLRYRADDGYWYITELKGRPGQAIPETGYTLADIGLTVPAGTTVTDGQRIKLRFFNKLTPSYKTQRSMVQMGAYVSIWPDKVFCNVVKLASGETMVEGVDFGDLDGHYALIGTETSTPNNCPKVKLTLCDVEGRPYNNVVISSTAPQSTSSTWVEVNGNGVHIRIHSSSTWTEIPTVYVKVTAKGISRPFKAGDGVTLRFYILPWDTPSDHDMYLDQLLNSSHVIVKAEQFGNNPSDNDYIVLTGVFVPASQTDQQAEMTGATWWTYEAGSETFLIRDHPTQGGNLWKHFYIDREVPEMDFVVECENRLWGCFCGEKDGEHLNEIYASKLGDFRNWNVFQGVATDSYVASRGADGAFTGAAVLDGHPLFFRERCVEKVFPSASGAHQIQTQTLDGVQQGSGRSLAIIDDRLYYKGVGGVYVYTGTLPQLISPQFGEERYHGAAAGVHGKKYYVAMREGASDASETSSQGDGVEAEAPGWVLFSFDTASGIWHREDAPWDPTDDPGCMVSWRGGLYYCVERSIWCVDGTDDRRGIRWFSESGPMGLSETDRKFVSRISLRYRLELGAAVTVQIQYDESGRWQTVKRLGGTKLHAGTLAIWPRRCDTFRLRLEGVGGFVLYSIGWERERGSDV